MKALGINASPRENSNRRLALETAFEVAKENGAECEIVDIKDLAISPCQVDRYCKMHNSECALNDDVADIYKKIEEADAIVLATPIYFCDVSAQAKIFIDRLFAYFMNEEFSKLFVEKKVSIIASHGAAPFEIFEGSLNTQMNVFTGLGFKTGEIIALGDNNEPGAFAEKENQIAKVKALGENLFN